eukprot:6594001-Prymnesium_polylepis.1
MKKVVTIPAGAESGTLEVSLVPRQEYSPMLEFTTQIVGAEAAIPAIISQNPTTTVRVFNLAAFPLNCVPKDESMRERARVVIAYCREIMRAPDVWYSVWRHHAMLFFLAGFDNCASSFAYQEFVARGLAEGRSDWALMIAAALMAGEVLRFHLNGWYFDGQLQANAHLRYLISSKRISRCAQIPGCREEFKVANDVHVLSIGGSLFSTLHRAIGSGYAQTFSIFYLVFTSIKQAEVTDDNTVVVLLPFAVIVLVALSFLWTLSRVQAAWAFVKNEEDYKIGLNRLEDNLMDNTELIKDSKTSQMVTKRLYDEFINECFYGFCPRYYH